MPGRPTNLDYSRARACCASLQQIQDGWAVALFLYVSSILSHLYSNYLFLFCSSISCPLSLSIPFSFAYQSHVHYLFPFHSKYFIFLCLSISCPLSVSIPFKVSHFLLFINLMSSISFHSIQSISFSFVYQSHVHYLFPLHSNYLIFFCSSISCPLSLSIAFKLSHSLLFINLMFIILSTPFHLNYLIIRMIVSGTPIPYLSHSLSFINLMPTYSIQISHSLKLFINFMPIISFHSNYFPLFISLMSTIPDTPIPFKVSHQIVSGTPVPVLSHSPLFINLMHIISGTSIFVIC